MAYTEFGTTDAATVKLWSKQVLVAQRDYLEIDPLISGGQNNVIIEKTELADQKGDEITCSLRMRLGGDGFSEDDVAEGSGENMAFYTQKVKVNELLHLVGLAGPKSIKGMRAPYDIRSEAKDALGEWHGERLSKIFFTQVCGYTAETNPKRYGFNTPIAPSAGRQIWPGAITNDQSLTNSYPFTLDLIDTAMTQATTGSNRIRPINIKGRKKFLLYIHPAQKESLRKSAGNSMWSDIQKAALQGGSGEDSHLYDGAMGEYNDCIIRVGQDVTPGVHSGTGASVSNVRRAVLLGAGAVVLGRKKFENGEKFSWFEREFDSGRKAEASAQQNIGMVKSQYAGTDLGTLVISTYSSM